MGTKEIQKAIGKMQVLKFHSPVAENVKYLINDFELDVISLSKSGMLYEFEVKISRGDFLADKKKRKNEFYSHYPNRQPNYFSYACPEGLIKLSDIGGHIGLYYVNNEEVTEIRAPKRIHRNPHDKIKILEKVSRIHSERQYLNGCRMTYNNKNSKYINGKMKTTKERLAEMLNGREYRNETTPEIIKLAQENALVIVYGASDDLIELEGAVSEEFGTLVYLDENGNEIENCEDGCVHSKKALENAHKIEGDYGNEGWAFRTTLPRADFKIYEDGELYCIGFVFDMGALTKPHGK